MAERYVNDINRIAVDTQACSAAQKHSNVSDRESQYISTVTMHHSISVQ
jgi:hypothetical protein